MKIFKSTFLVIIILFLVFTINLFIIFKELCNDKIDFTPGTFGDFMGGVIGTILTFVASVFVYKAYETQKQQLELQKKEANQSLVDNLYDKITKEIEDLQLSYRDMDAETITLKGVEVLYNFKDFYKNQNTVLNQLCLILISFEHLFKLTKDSTYKWERQLEINQDRNYLLFYTKIVWPIHQFYSQEWDKLITKWSPPHPDSLGTRTRFEKLLKETYAYLLKRELIGMTEDEAYKKIIQKT